jgi:hypothetical protein
MGNWASSLSGIYLQEYSPRWKSTSLRVILLRYMSRMSRDECRSQSKESRPDVHGVDVPMKLLVVAYSASEILRQITKLWSEFYSWDYIFSFYILGTV